MKVVQILSIFLFAASLQAQSPKKTVILYNTVPLKVDVLPDGTITSVYGRADGYLKGYKIVKKQDTNSNSNGLYSEDKGFAFVAKENYPLSFEESKSILSRPIIENLDKIADAIFFSEKKMALVIGYTPNSTTLNSTTLLENRMKAILAYLDIKGVDRLRIVIDADVQQSDSGTILVNIVE